MQTDFMKAGCREQKRTVKGSMGWRSDDRVTRKEPFRKTQKLALNSRQPTERAGFC